MPPPLPPLRNANNKAGKLVILKGVPGSGKSTAAAAIKETVEARDGVCIIGNMDQYLVKKGMTFQNAQECVKKDLLKVLETKNDDVVVVIDTCGATGVDSRRIFFLDFVGWKRIEIWPNLDRQWLSGYFAWSLYKILTRTEGYLSPQTTGDFECAKIHYDKAALLFPSINLKRYWKFSGSLTTLEPLAEEYQASIGSFVVPDKV